MLVVVQSFHLQFLSASNCIKLALETLMIKVKFLTLEKWIYMRLHEIPFKVL